MWKGGAWIGIYNEEGSYTTWEWARTGKKIVFYSGHFLLVLLSSLQRKDRVNWKYKWAVEKQAYDLCPTQVCWHFHNSKVESESSLLFTPSYLSFFFLQPNQKGEEARIPLHVTTKNIHPPLLPEDGIFFLFLSFFLAFSLMYSNNRGRESNTWLVTNWKRKKERKKEKETKKQRQR